jgi:hypothetical protein
MFEAIVAVSVELGSDAPKQQIAVAEELFPAKTAHVQGLPLSILHASHLVLENFEIRP